MKIRLVSRDQQIEKLCRDGLAELYGADADLVLDPDDRLGAGGGVSIVDLDAIPEPASEPERNFGPASILLYSRERLASMRGALPAATILLKPLQRELFLTVLGCAIDQAKLGANSAQRAGGETVSPESEAALRQAQPASPGVHRLQARQMHFLSRALHDLRAPLTAIEGYTGLLLAERFGQLTATQRESLKRMQQSIGRLSRMTTDIFRLSLGERRDEGPDLQVGDLAHCVQQVLGELMPLAEGKQIQVTHDMITPVEPIQFDSAQIHSVVTNLVENACRFTPRNGSIEVRGYSVFWDRRRAGRRENIERERRAHNTHGVNAYRVDIRDSGPGVAAQHLDSIFEPYTSYSGGQDRAGSGLGLAICRMVVNAHRGRVFAEPGGQGAIFSFVLPFVERPARRQPQAESDRQSAAWRRGAAGETA